MHAEHVDIKTPEYVSLKYQTAALGSRSAAFLIDSVILMLFNIAVIIGLLIFLNATFLDLFYIDVPSYIIAGASILLFVINWSYFFLFEYFTGGRTLGKKFIGIRVIQDNGHSITLLSSLIRNLLRIIDMLPINYLVGMTMIFFHSKHKRLGDLVAGTIVVHERGKKKKKKSSLDRNLEERGITGSSPIVDEWALRQLTAKDWKLLKTYASRISSLASDDRSVLSRKVADILFPKVGLHAPDKSYEELEVMLLRLYVLLKEEWEYEL
ncbi:RDD family protein [Bacillus sp. THAF10]|uniref:RDD family protein n=1 Tax=Bacillus sp. THAF10 TaxID=2587848 RepID=UPI001267E10F|nr:RDD family protein [Bacillus sp. THAF10]QFT89092.1 RDD family protein [Bacillus sp. THAF10]